MFMNKSEMRRFYMSIAAGSLMWMLMGASVVLLTYRNHYLAVAALCLAMMCWPYRLKFQMRRLTADSFEEAMSEMMEIEKREKR
jgi:hypothetical protein